MKLKIALTIAVLAISFAPFQSFAQTVPGVLPAFITAGLIDPNGKVPAVNGVPGAGTPNMAVAFPTTVLTHGTSYVYTVAAQNYSFSGTCVASYKLTQLQSGKTVILDSGTINTFSCASGEEWAFAAFGNAIPNSPGPATLIGLVKFGTTTIKTKTAVVLQ
jgi:hypothetical protein